MAISAVPPKEYIRMIGGYVAEDYHAIGKHFFDIFVRLGELKPTDRVLDVGCGCGRMAVPMTDYLTTGTYLGLEMIEVLVQWCKENITPAYPHFQFQHVGVKNGRYDRYNTKDSGRSAREFDFPCEDGSIDFVLLTSVFTHMLPADMEHYAREIRRVLAPGGRAVITWYILNDESMRLKDLPESPVKIPFPYLDGQVMVADIACPEAVTGYPEATVRKSLAEAGLELQEPIHFGSWCGRKGTVTFQDLTVVIKR